MEPLKIFSDFSWYLKTVNFRSFDLKWNKTHKVSIPSGIVLGTPQFISLSRFKDDFNILKVKNNILMALFIRLIRIFLIIKHLIVKAFSAWNFLCICFHICLINFYFAVFIA